MSNSFRTLCAGLMLAFTALVMTSGLVPEQTDGAALPVIFLVFAHAWILAVGERGVFAKGLRVKRFPVGARLITQRPGLLGQMLVLVAVLTVLSRYSMGQEMGFKVGGVALFIVVMASFEMLRRGAKFLIPAAFVVHALGSMEEVHTLGDLVGTAGGWVQTVVWTLVGALVVFGSLLRTDVAGRLTAGGRVLAFVAGIPAYALGLWIGDLSWLNPGLNVDVVTRIGVALLLGSLAQTVLIGLVAPMVGLLEREPEDVPPLNGRNVGLATLPMLLPLLVWIALALQPIPESTLRGVALPSWMGLYLILLIVPAVPAAVLVASSIDRWEHRVATGRIFALASAGALVAWIGFGPVALGWLYAPGGPLVELRDHFGVLAFQDGLVAGFADSAGSMTGAALGGGLMIRGVPAADLLRSVGFMLLATACLSARYMSYARPRVPGMGWRLMLFLAMFMGGGLWLLVPRLGVIGAPLAAGVAASLMAVVDLVTGQAEQQRDPRALEDMTQPA